MAEKAVTLLGISGSLRAKSFNTGLLKAAQGLMPEGATLQIYGIGDLPLFNSDLEASLPPSVAALKEAIRQADGLLLSGPEYNFSVSGVLKNALDWASRPGGKSVLAKKPVGIMGASMGALGTVRSQGHMRQILTGVQALAMPTPEVLVAAAQDKFSADTLELTDAKTRDFLKRYLADLVAWIHLISGRSEAKAP